MEKKRKLPPRAAARVEQSAKKRAATPSEPSPTSSSTPAPAPASASTSTTSTAHQKTPPATEPAPPEEPKLPTSIQPGNPLPTVENAQPDDLPPKDYQSVQESGVLAESLSRSRQRWITDGIFQKYWSKPTKRKGVIREEPNNPQKDTMTKIGQVTVTVEPHVLEATMYAVKDHKAGPTTNATFRPVIQYGPPNGVMPPPPKPKTPSTPATQPTPAENASAMTAPKTTAATATAGPPPSPLQTPSQPPCQSSQSQSQSQTQPQPRPQAQPQPQPQPQSQLQSPAQIQPPSAQSQAQAHVPTSTHPSQIQPPAPAPPGVPSHSRIPQPGPYRSPSATATPNQPLASPRGLESVLAPPQPQPSSAPIPPVSHPHAHAHSHAHSYTQPTPPSALSATSVSSQPPAPSRGLQGPNPPAVMGGPTIPPGTKAPSTPVAKQPPPSAPGADPIIVTLAERASEDPHLRDLMKRVALGDAAPSELAHFQRIIDQITAEYKRKGGQQGPSADRLLVDGRKVKYFADEVSSIVDIVLSSNPNQKSTDLKPPADSDPLVISLVKKVLDDTVVRDMVRRVAQNKTRFNDATELKSILDGMNERAPNEAPKSEPSTSAPSQATPSNGAEQGAPTNGTISRKNSLAFPAQHSNVASPQQALRSKGPPPTLKPDFSAIVLEFAGGGGDRYLFPKYSILEWSSPSQVLASFLIVRKGSQLEYGGDPALDYYQPVTMRLHSSSGKHLEYLTKVVAPEDEVRRYMDDVMDNMTRAEYVLLAMRLPREDEEDREDVGRSNTPKIEAHQSSQLGVLWNTKSSAATGAAAPRKPLPRTVGEDEQYQSFIASIS